MLTMEELQSVQCIYSQWQLKLSLFCSSVQMTCDLQGRSPGRMRERLAAYKRVELTYCYSSLSQQGLDHCSWDTVSLFTHTVTFTNIPRDSITTKSPSKVQHTTPKPSLRPLSPHHRHLDRSLANNTPLLRMPTGPNSPRATQSR